MKASDFIPSKPYTNILGKGSVCVQSPSNIALIKYWGKKGLQIPSNPSLSFTLSKSRTEITLGFEFLKSPGHDYDFELWFDGSLNETFKKKIITFFDRVNLYLPFLKNYRFKIETSNTFPHSSGIASSASSMSALSYAFVEVENLMLGGIQSDKDTRLKASFLSRLGSGSACRSLWGGLVSWGKCPTLEGGSDIYGTPLENTNIYPVFQTYQDTILLIDKGVKKISSSLGHQIMNTHPYRNIRYNQAEISFSKLLRAILKGDTEIFIKTVESEALTLHGLMMTSHPYFMLMKPNTLAIIQEVWRYREETKIPLCFTLDAGANVHLLYPKCEKIHVLKFIEDRLLVFCEDGEYICDEVGLGTNLITC